MINQKLNQIRGCLIGGAAGDALGSPVEFYYESQIFEKYGKPGIQNYELNPKHVAEITDDTQMTLFTAKGLLMNSHDAESIWHCYQDWYITQTKEYADNLLQYAKDLNIPELFEGRSPGYTCTSAVKNGIPGTIRNPINDSKGCGGVMRIAPIGLYFHGKNKKSMQDIDLLGAQAAALTHGHELGYIPAAAQVHMIHTILEHPEKNLKSVVLDAITAMQGIFKGANYLREFVRIMKKAVWLAEEEIDDLTAIHVLGEGWVAEETLAIAVYCALRYPDHLEKALIASVNHNGDRDSTGAVTGNLLGAYLGYDAIPEKFKRNLELHDLILQLADSLNSVGD
ncbi:MAG: ADP-ribosylglycohydrolase family protein [Oscillospiraceae bacterium]|nr:ADP-ribosylglycohydrolase family protein [Oscillospiraceae bacterium]